MISIFYLNCHRHVGSLSLILVCNVSHYLQLIFKEHNWVLDWLPSSQTSIVSVNSSIWKTTSRRKKTLLQYLFPKQKHNYFHRILQKARTYTNTVDAFKNTEKLTKETNKRFALAAHSQSLWVHNVLGCTTKDALFTAGSRTGPSNTCCIFSPS